MECAKLVAALAKIVGDVGIAEELAQDALVIALEQWPVQGIPQHPASWLMATAKHRAIDLLRRRDRYQDKLATMGRQLRQVEDADWDAALDDPVGDDLLRLVFTVCHPGLPAEGRVALTLRAVGGLTTAEIARALLAKETTIGQRIVRTKRTLTDKRIALELPPASQLTERLASVLEVVYLIFNEGYSATSGGDWTRPDLCAEALRLGRVLAHLLPDRPEVHGLSALMELQASRMPARSGPGGAPVLLLDQDRTRWDHQLIRRGLASLERAERLGGALHAYTLQAGIAACHARARTAADTDWERIANLYQVLAYVSPSPVVDLNHAVAVGMAKGPEHGLSIVDRLAAGGALARYPQLPAVRGDLLARLGRAAEARAEFETAAALTRNERERDVFLRRAAEL
ncbi:RNA polymerase sigma factor [Amycolatopsis sp. K13G38]|uniref:RNA polymerase sigma factor n=1 Tax=Amycolatopsis acididurans TaxID=2724524 RepID=A0ABX1JEP6_9PSEU|nr:RNA polymerase sigma factor [Amycolatopsis acididurans]